jgi:hypothetical protein
LEAKMNTTTTTRDMPALYVGKRPGRLGRGGFQVWPLEQLYELNSRMSRVEALLERIAAAAEAGR